MLSCLEMAVKLEQAAQSAAHLEVPTEKLMLSLEVTAKGFIGHYQEDWEPLAYATLYGGVSPEGHHYPGKVELGYAPPDNPLLRTGELRDSIEHWSAEMPDGAIGEIGSHDLVALWQELGTARGIPPRPFLGLAMFHSQEPATVIFGEFATAILSP